MSSQLNYSPQLSKVPCTLLPNRDTVTALRENNNMWGWVGVGGTSAAHRWTCREYGDEWVVEEKQMNEKWAEHGYKMDWSGKNRWMRNEGTWKAWKTEKEMHHLIGIMGNWQINKVRTIRMLKRISNGEKKTQQGIVKSNRIFHPNWEK